MVSRVCQLLLTAGVAFYVSLIVMGNLTDYDTNFVFVQHVLSMDTIFPDSTLRWRAVTSPTLHRVFYGGLIAWEAGTALLCWVGAYRLMRALRSDAAAFQLAKDWAIAGLTAGCLLWLVAFLAVGGEWFAMWQSPTWNGQNAAFRMFAVTGIVLVFLCQRHRE
jgi:predicted small integral membrane protein